VLAGMVAGGIGVVAVDQLLPTVAAKPKFRRGTGTLLVEIRDDNNAPVPARLTFKPVGDTPRTFFTTTDIAREEIGAVAAFDRVFILRGDADLRVPVGTYDVWISHGPEWDTSRIRVTIKPASESELDVKLHHVVDTPGWISGDFHVHSAASLDSRVPLRDRVHQFVADGVDLIVATDHNVIADYAPVIAELGVKDLLASATGDEITTKSWGHFGSFPLRADETELGHGAIPTGEHVPAQIFADVRKKAPAALIDIHHPRLEHGKIGYFHLAEFDDTSGLAKRAGFSLDFDAIEVLNGYQDPDRRNVERVIRDWTSFLDAGKHVAATGNSDTHHMTFNLGGYPRNYVHVGDVTLDKLDPVAVAAAVKAGHSFITTGPIVEADIGGKSYGDTAVATAGKVDLHVKVRAANWVQTTKLTVIGPGGVELASQKLPPSLTSTLRFDGNIPIEMAKDGYLIIRIDGEHPMAPNCGDEGSFPVFPFALTNPIWIDADGDGKVKPAKPFTRVDQP